VDGRQELTVFKHVRLQNLLGSDSIFVLSCLFCREELEKQKDHERYMKLQEQGKTEQARKDLGENSFKLSDTLLAGIEEVAIDNNLNKY